MSEHVLEVKNLKKVYGIHTASEFETLHYINFTCDNGEFICIMGPSGSGKSTFINNISTIDNPTSGKVYIQGVEIRTMSSNEIGKFRYENLGFIFQDFNLLDTHTIYENIAMPLSLKKVKAALIHDKIQQLAQSMNIDALLKKYPHECSGGQRQRAAICRALVNDPKIIIADEPTGNLDSVNSNELLKLLQQLNQENGVTIIMVSHDSLIASYSTRLIYIKDGLIDQTLERKDMTQEEYFQRIVEINATQSKDVFHQ
ncbi:MAG: ABC transporter ATP-binding protein [Erysipelotrichaceae bacterium]|nr:ABC transporter ATP-binding protein [Erysipelotrichaceae bacterium]